MPLDLISTENLDSDLDSPHLARVQLFQAITTINTLIGDARIAFSQNPIVLPIDISGNPNYSAASAQARVYRFVQDETASWLFSSVNTDCTATVTVGGAISIISSAKDVAYCDITATRGGYPNITARLTIFRNASAAVATPPDITVPPTPTGLAVVAGINSIHLTWTAASYLYGRRNEYTTIYGAIWDGVTAPVFGDGSVLKRGFVLGTNNVGDFVTDPATKWCIWITFRSRDGIESLPGGGLHGVQVESGQDPTKLLAILNSQISASQLNSDLNTKVGLITAGSGTPGSVAAQVQAEANLRIGAINQEVTDRNTAIGVETGLRVAAVNTINTVKNRTFYSGTPPISDGSYTLATNDIWFDTSTQNRQYRYNGSAWVIGGDLRLTQAVSDISSETSQRSIADTAEANIRTSLYAGVFAGAGNDYKIFNQSTSPTATTIGDVWSWIDGAGTVTFKRWNGSTWVDSVGNTRAAYYRGAYTDQTAIDALSGNVIGDLARRISDNIVVVWNGSAWVTAAAPTSQNSAFLSQENAVRTANDVAEASARTTLATQMRGSYTGTDITAMTSGLLFDEKTARSSADATEVTARQLISTKAFGVTDPTGLTLSALTTGLLFDERTSRSTADASEVTARQLISTKAFGVADPTSATLGSLSSGIIYDELQARSSADTSQVSRISTLETSLNSGGVTYNSIVAVASTASSKNASFVQGSAPTATKIGDTWIDTGNSRKLMSWNGSAWVASDDTRIGASASQITTLQSTSDSNYITVQQEISTRATETGYLGGKYFVRAQVTSGGRTVMGGFGIEGTSGAGQQATIDFGVQADKFWIGATSGNAGIADVRPFVVQTSNAVDPGTGVMVPKGVYMDSAYITNLTAIWANFGSVIATSISTTNLNASKLTLGDGTVGGQLKSSNFSTGVGGWILRPDGTAQLPAAYIIGQLTASQINTNGLTIRDAGGAIILNASATYPLDWTKLGGQPDEIYNTNIAVSGGAITGIGTGSGTVIDNSLVTATGIGAVKTDASNAPASIRNSNIAVSGGAITGIGTGAGTVVDNSLVTATGIGAVKTDASNAPASILNSNVTVSSLDSTIVRAANPINASNVVTYISNLAVGTLQIADQAISITSLVSQYLLTSIGGFTNGVIYNTPLYVVIVPVTYTTRCFGGRKIELAGFRGVTTYSHVAGTVSSSIYYSFVIRRTCSTLNGGLPEVIQRGARATGSNQSIGLDATLVLDAASIGSPGTSVSLTYDVALEVTFSAPETASFGVTLPVKSYPADRYISVVEYQK